MILSLFKSLICPSVEATIYRKFVKPKIEEFNTNLSHLVVLLSTVILVTIPAVLSTGTLEKTVSLPYKLLGLLGAIVGLIVVLSSFVISGVSCEIVNSMSLDQHESRISVENMVLLVDTYKSLTEVMQPYIFLHYSTNVCALTVNLYMIVLNMSGCDHFVSNKYFISNSCIYISIYLILILTNDDQITKIKIYKSNFETLIVLNCMIIILFLYFKSSSI